MSTLKEFLVSQRDRTAKERDAVCQTRAEWLTSLDRLIAQVRDWLKEADPDGEHLKIEEERHALDEEAIGAYEAPGLSITLGATRVRLVPIARYVSGTYSDAGKFAIIRAYGRVDLTNGIEKHLIFRERFGPDGWCIVEYQGFEKAPFNRATFEAALKTLLE